MKYGTDNFLSESDESFQDRNKRVVLACEILEGKGKKVISIIIDRTQNSQEHLVTFFWREQAATLSYVGGGNGDG